MRKYSFSRIFITISTMLAMIVAILPAAQAGPNLVSGTVFKGRGHSTLYYLNSDNKRLVFPNEATYLSWYDDFDEVVEIDDADLAQYSLVANVRYRPGALLVKVQSDPKVYAVGPNGALRWIKTERVARQLYGDNWNLLVDDVPTAFFVNYSLSDDVDDETDFDPEAEEEEITSINENIKARIQAKVRQRVTKLKARICKLLENRLNKIQHRLARRGITVNTVGDNYVDQCLVDDTGDDDGDKNDDDIVRDNKVSICHIPPGNPDAAHTITVGKAAARAHLAHGDTIGACAGDGDDGGDGDDTAPPVISEKTATPTATSTTVTWQTDEASTSAVEYAAESLATATSTTQVSSDTLVTSHSVFLEGLESETTYFYVVESKDETGNKATSTEMSFTTLSIAEPDTLPPVISDILAAPTSTSAVISWTTDEDSTSKVEYATESLTTASTTLEVMDAAFVTSHSLDLLDLATSTEYFFKVESKDESGNTSTSGEQSFTTL